LFDRLSLTSPLPGRQPASPSVDTQIRPLMDA
jgi:hypothetical protein